MPDARADWRERGEIRRLSGHQIFTVDLPPRATAAPREALVVLHGFPTSSFDFHRVADALAQDRRVLFLDFLGYGFSDKPDLAYTIEIQADLVEGFVAEVGVDTFALLTHDMGDTVGGELLARQMEGRWPVTVTRRVLTNGSIYISMAHLTDGQELLLSLPDAALPVAGSLDQASLEAGLAVTFSESSQVDSDDLAEMAACVLENGGDRILPRLIRYVEQRRANERRYTGAIESHPAPLTVGWASDDPVAVAPMADRLSRAVPAASVTRLDGVGHYPMIEAPDRFIAAVHAGLGG